MKTTLNLSQLYRPISSQVDQVRASISSIWREALGLVRVEMDEQPAVGGKLLRPALCLLASGALGARDLDRYVPLATAYEALHIASLAHDDVIDRAILRRGASALNMLWDNHAAVLGGDYLVARSVEILATYDSCAVIANAIRSVRRMAEGELVFFGREHEPFRREDCIHLAEQKTASLFAEACSAPSHLFEQCCRDPLHRYGTALGIAFQIVDDLIDLTQTTAELGKPACGDIVEGKRTLPIMYMRDGLDFAERARLDALRGAEMTDADRTWVHEAVERTGARERTEGEARHFADQALEALGELPASEFRDSMEGVVEFILIRSS